MIDKISTTKRTQRRSAVTVMATRVKLKANRYRDSTSESPSSANKQKKIQGGRIRSGSKDGDFSSRGITRERHRPRRIRSTSKPSSSRARGSPVSIALTENVLSPLTRESPFTPDSVSSSHLIPRALLGRVTPRRRPSRLGTGYPVVRGQRRVIDAHVTGVDRTERVRGALLARRCVHTARAHALSLFPILSRTLIENDASDARI